MDAIATCKRLPEAKFQDFTSLFHKVNKVTRWYISSWITTFQGFTSIRPLLFWWQSRWRIEHADFFLWTTSSFFPYPLVTLRVSMRNHHFFIGNPPFIWVTNHIFCWKTIVIHILVYADFFFFHVRSLVSLPEGLSDAWIPATPPKSIRGLKKSVEQSPKTAWWSMKRISSIVTVMI